MADPVLKLVRGATELVLGVGTTLPSMPRYVMEEWSGFSVATNDRKPNPVFETMRFRGEATSTNQLATLEQSLTDMEIWANQYATDQTQLTPVWLYRQAKDETGTARACVRKIVQKPESGYYDTDALAWIRHTQCGIERMPFWESITAVNMGSANPAAASSVVYDYTSVADIVGDVGARISDLHIVPNVGSNLGRLWIGVRSANKHPTLANFVNIWECESGTPLTDASTTADANASGGNIVAVSFNTTTTWARRMQVTLTNVAGINLTSQYGRFLSLLRAKVAAGKTCEVYLKFGYVGMDSSEFSQGPTVRINNTSYDYYETGLYKIPLRNPQVEGISGDEASFTIEVWARLVSGAAGANSLSLDCINPIPNDEGGLKSWWTTEAGNTGYWYFGYSPLGHKETAVLANASSVVREPFVDAPYFVLPPGDGRMYIVYARAASSVLADRITINGTVNGTNGLYYPRWAGLRGAE